MRIKAFQNKNSASLIETTLFFANFLIKRQGKD